MSFINPDEQMVEFLDLVDFTLSARFMRKWKDRYSERLVRLFQLKILGALDNSRPIKATTLFSYLCKKCKYSEEYIRQFFIDIELEDYEPIVTGVLSAA